MQLIVPSIVETQITGFILAGEETWYKHTLRVELWPDACKCFVDGKPTKIEASKQGLKFLAIAKQLALINLHR